MGRGGYNPINGSDALPPKEVVAIKGVKEGVEITKSSCLNEVISTPLGSAIKFNSRNSEIYALKLRELFNNKINNLPLDVMSEEEKLDVLNAFNACSDDTIISFGNLWYSNIIRDLNGEEKVPQELQGSELGRIASRVRES